MSMIPMGGNVVRPNPRSGRYLSGLLFEYGFDRRKSGAEIRNHARSRRTNFRLQSHQKAAAAIKEGKFKDEIVPFTVRIDETRRKRSRSRRKEIVFDTDEGVRYDATMEGFAKLKPAFHAKGTVTAGNASQMSDGAAAVVMMSAGKSRRIRLETACAFCRLRDRRLSARRNGHRSGLRDSESFENGWFDAGRH